MDFEVPPLLAERARTWGGADGVRWLSALPELVATLSSRWRLTLGTPMPSHVSYLAPATDGAGRRVVLKVPMAGVAFPYAPSDHRVHEPAAMRGWGARVTVELLEVDVVSGAMVLEACSPGTALADEVVDPEEIEAIAGDLLPRLWVSPPSSLSGIPLHSTADLAAEWRRRVGSAWPVAGAPTGFDPSLVELATSLLDRFAAEDPPATLLHGDFHPRNILRAQRRPWLVIDPLPLVGDPAYDAVMFLLFRLGTMDDPAHAWAGAISSWCSRLGLDEQRVKEWTLVRLVTDALAFASHGGSVEELEAPRQDLWGARQVRSML